MIASTINTSETRWPKATRERPCPNCGKFNRCLIAPKGDAGVCWRSGSKEVWQNKPGSNGKHHRADPKPSKPKTTYVSAEAAMEAAGKFIEGGGTLTATYVYPGDVARVGRFALPDGGKTCRPVHRVANGWCVGDPPGKWALYRSDELPNGGTVYVVEGEKCSDLARKLGLPATTSAHGSSSADASDWTPLIEHRGDIVMLPDADEAGEKYIAHAARIVLTGNPEARIKIVRLPGLSNGEDIEQFYEGEPPERVRAEVESLVDETPLTEHSAVLGGLIVTKFSDIKRQPIRWLWPQRIALGKLCLFYGDPEKGKSTLLIHLASVVSRGGEWPDGTSAPRGTVIYLSYEDDAADTIGPRLDAADADSTRVLSLAGVRLPSENGKMIERGVTLGDIGHLRDTLKRFPDVRLILIDPVSAALPDKKDSNSNSDVRGMLSELSKLASEFGIAIVMLTHMPKHGGGGKAIYSAMGSVAFIAASRSAWMIAVDPSNPDRRLMLCAKNNLAPHGQNLAFHIAGPTPHIIWDGAVSTTANEALIGEESTERHGPEPKALEAAKEWLRAELQNEQEHRVDDLKALAKSAAISWRTVERASQKMGVRSHRATFGGGYVWRLPKLAAPLLANMPANGSGVWRPGDLADKENQYE